MQEFDTPLRLTWDLAGRRPVLDAPPMRVLAQAIAEAGVLFVTLTGEPLHHPAHADVLGALEEGGCRVMAVVPDATGLDGQTRVAEVALDAAPWLSAADPQLEGLAGCLGQVRAAGREPLLWLAPFTEYLPDIARLLRFCARQGVGRFKLSNLPINASVEPLEERRIPRPGDLDGVLPELLAASRAAGARVQLDIHDRFLWEVLAAQGASLVEYDGCQAANALAHLDARGGVQPCSSWPEPLGSLLETPLDEIWASEARRTLRARIAEVPAGCRGCRDYPLCFAGCRGLSACFDFANQGRDPLCSGLRQGAGTDDHLPR